MVCLDAEYLDMSTNNRQSLGGNAPQGWKTPYVLVLLILGAILIISFIVWECRYPYAMIDMNIWRDRDFSLVSRSICTFFETTLNSRIPISRFEPFETNPTQ